MTYNEILQDIKDRLNLTSATADARLGRVINRVYKKVTTAVGLNLSRNTVVSAPTIANDPYVTFVGVEKISAVLDTVTGKPIDEVSFDTLRRGIATGACYGPGSKPTYAIARMGASTVTILLSVTPTTVYSLRADAQETVTTLSGTMEPAFAESFHDVLVEGVLIDELAKLEKQSLSQQAKLAYEQRLSDIRMWIAKSKQKDLVQGGLRNLQLMPTPSFNVATLPPPGLIVNLADGATIPLDASLGFEYRLVMSGNHTISVPTNPTAGQQIVITVKADGAPYTLTLDTSAGGFNFGTKIPSLTLTPANTTDYIGAFYNDVTGYWDVCAYVKGY